MPTPVFLNPDTLPKTPLERWNANVAAIGLVKELQAADRQATPEEQAVLARYSGFGDSAFNDAFDGRYTADRNWKARGEELRELVSEDEYHSIERSRLTAYYTTPEVVSAMWQGLEEMGAGDLTNPVVLEPSAGAGRFLGLQPPEMAAKSDRYAVELDELTGQILRHAYPDTTTYITGFQNAPIPDNYVDIAISNVPFGDYPVVDPAFRDRRDLAGSIHNYFFAKTLDKLRPGGVMAYITSNSTMDAKNPAVREYLAGRADLVGAVRLPKDAFPDTEVVTDILYFRKRKPGETPGDASWLQSVDQTLEYGRGGQGTANVNEYFVRNPDKVLGTPSLDGSMYRDGSYTVSGRRGPELNQVISRELRESIGSAPRIEDHVPSQPIHREADGGDMRPEGQYFLNDQDQLKVVTRDYETKQVGWTAPKQKTDEPKPKYEAVPVSQHYIADAGLSETDEARVRMMLTLRDDARTLLDLEQADADLETLDAARTGLFDQYRRFVKQYGQLNDRKNVLLMKADPDGTFLRALEVCEKAGCVPADIFEHRVKGGVRPQVVETTSDALAVSLNATGRIDFDAMGEMLGQEPGEVRRNLLEQELVFRNPETGGYETADQYLSGSVRRKHAAAKTAADARPGEYAVNSRALERVQPEDLGPADIVAPLGAPWVPDRMLNEWVHDRFKLWGLPGEYYRYSDATGRWIAEQKIIAPEAVMNAEWGTENMAAPKILDAALVGKPIKLNTRNNPERELRYDPEASLEAQEKAHQMEEDFQKWVWEDPQRAEQLARIYNETQNDLVPRRFEGSHQTFPGMSARWQKQMRSHQRDAIYRVVQEGTALLAHEVGFGKTAVMVASGMERRRLGLVQKPVYVVPKATHGQFRGQFEELYPDAKILFPGEDDFNPKNRAIFQGRMRTGDWDAIILTYEQFEKIPVRPETQEAWMSLQIRDIRAALAESTRAGNQRSRSHKQLEKALEQERAKLERLQDDLAQRRDTVGEYFEDLGIDAIYVDEADNYKNLTYHSQLTDLKGLPRTGSQRAWDMLMKTQYVQGFVGNQQVRDVSGGGGFARNGVVFATGTPIANTIAEAWTMMRYLQMPELRRRNYHHFDAWAKTFGKITVGMEVKPTGAYKQTARFDRFRNIPELSHLFQNVADIRVASEVPTMLERQPRLVDDEGQSGPIVVQAPAYPSLQQYMNDLHRRSEKLGKVDPSVDNMLKISSDARLASLDIRTVEWPFDEPPEPNPDGKIPLAAKRAAEVYRRETPDKGAQLMFLDVGTPKAEKGDAATAEESAAEAEALSGAEKTALKDMYRLLKNDLIAEGVPEEQIAFIHDYKKKGQQQELFKAVNKGDMRILVGSTGKLGTGVNVQERLAAVHHIDVPWRPRDVEQREGRIIRQGNQVYGPVIDPTTGDVTAPGRGVQVFYYVQEGSFDQFMWQGVEKKAISAKSLVKRHVTAREIEDIDPLVLSSAEAKALASGDQRVMKLEEFKARIQRLQMAQHTHRNQQFTAEAEVGQLEQRLDRLEGLLPKAKADAAIAERELASKGDFEMAVGDERFDKRADAEEALVAALKTLPYKARWEKVGEYRGFDIEGQGSDEGWRIALVNPNSGLPHQSSIVKSLTNDRITPRADNVLKQIAGYPPIVERDVADNRVSLDFYRNQIGGGFAGAEELGQLEQDANLLRDSLQGSKPEPDDEELAVWHEALAGNMTETEKEEMRQRRALAIARLQDQAAVEAILARDSTGFRPASTPAAAAPAPVENLANPADAAEAIAEGVRDGDTGAALDRVAERVEEEAQDEFESEGVAVITASDTDAVMLEEMRDAGASVPDAGDDGPTAEQAVAWLRTQPETPLETPAEPEPATIPDREGEMADEQIADGLRSGGRDFTIPPRRNDAGAETVVTSPTPAPEPPMTVVGTESDPSAEEPLPATGSIIQQVNDRFGDIPQADKDKIISAIAEDLPAMVAADRAFQNAVAHSDLQNTKIEHQAALEKAVTSLVTTNTELFREFNDNPAFRDWLTEVNFTDTYEQVSKTSPANPSAARSAAPQPAEVPDAASDTDDEPAPAVSLGKMGSAVVGDLNSVAASIEDLSDQFQDADRSKQRRLKKQLGEQWERWFAIVDENGLTTEDTSMVLDEFQSKGRHADDPELRQKWLGIYRDWESAIGPTRARERADAEVAELVADAYDSPDAPAFALAEPENNIRTTIELPASFADIAPEWSSRDFTMRPPAVTEPRSASTVSPTEDAPPASDPVDVLAVVPDSEVGPLYGSPLAEIETEQQPEPDPQDPGVPSVPEAQTGSDIIAAPEIIPPVDGSASVQDVPPPEIPEISTNDNVTSLRQKWLRGDRNLDQYAAAFGIKNIPNDAAQLFLKADGSLGVRRLGAPPQPPVSVETPKRKSGEASGTGGGGSSSPAPTQMTYVPAMSTLTDWNQLSIEEKLYVITTINQALAERSRLALGLMLMTCDDTGGLDVLKKGERIGKIPASNLPCVPVAVVATRAVNGASSRKPAAAHVWHSRRETRAAAGRR